MIITDIDYLENCVYFYICSFRLNLKGKTEISAQGFCSDNECWRLYENKVHTLLKEGLGDRAKLVRVTWQNATTTCSIVDVCDFMHGEHMPSFHMHSNY